MTFTPLELVEEESHFGGKALSLGRALRAGLSVPPGIALDVEAVDAIASGSANADFVDRMFDALDDVGYAVRSSAIGEDSDSASFAGQHITRLGVRGREAIIEAIIDVHASGRTDSALAYRRRLGLDETPRVAVVVQRMIDADRAGVLFTVNPVTAADERMVEASWGLGETIVGGLVTPDSWRMNRGGEVVAQTLGEKDVEIVMDGDGVVERTVDDARATTFCLSTAELAALEQLAVRCEQYYEGPSDIEFAFASSELYLLQRRAVTR